MAEFVTTSDASKIDQLVSLFWKKPNLTTEAIAELDWEPADKVSFAPRVDGVLTSREVDYFVKVIENGIAAVGNGMIMSFGLKLLHNANAKAKELQKSFGGRASSYVYWHWIIDEKGAKVVPESENSFSVSHVYRMLYGDPYNSKAADEQTISCSGNLCIQTSSSSPPSKSIPASEIDMEKIIAADTNGDFQTTAVELVSHRLKLAGMKCHMDPVFNSPSGTCVSILTKSHCLYEYYNEGIAEFDRALKTIGESTYYYVIDSFYRELHKDGAACTTIDLDSIPTPGCPQPSDPNDPLNSFPPLSL